MDPKNKTEVSEEQFLLAACRIELVKSRDGRQTHPMTTIRLIEAIDAAFQMSGVAPDRKATSLPPA